MIELLLALLLTLFVIAVVILSDVKKKQNSILNRLDVLEGSGKPGVHSSTVSDVSDVPEEPDKPDDKDMVSEPYSGSDFVQPKAEKSTKQNKKSGFFHFFYSDTFKMINRRFMENWIAVVAVIILVAGISYFGIWASSRISSGLRFSFIVLVAIALFGLSYFLKNKEKYSVLSGWLRSGAGAVYLFATLGAGGIPGLQWINNPLFAFIFLLTGIAMNLFLSFIVKKEYFSGLHIILSLVALAIAPQNATTLFVAAIISLVGFSLQMRKKADVHHLMTLITFFLYIFYWGWKADTSIGFYNMSAVGVILTAGCVTLLLHYRKVYSNHDFDVLPFSIHLLNWLFVTVGLVRFAPGFRLVSIPLFIFALSLFALARYGRRLNIRWLYLSDTMIAQLVTVLSVILLLRVQLNHMSIFFIVLAETIIFHRIVTIEGNPRLVAFGALLVGFSSSFMAIYSINADLMKDRNDFLIAFLFLFASIGVVSFFLLSDANYVKKRPKEFLSGIVKWVHSISILIIGFVSFFLVFNLYILSERNNLLPSYLSDELVSVIPFVILIWVRYRLIVIKSNSISRFTTTGMTTGLYAYIVLTASTTIISAVASRPANPGFAALKFLPGVAGAFALIWFSGFPKKKTENELKQSVRVNPGVIAFTFLLVILLFFAFGHDIPLLVSVLWMCISVLHLYIASSGLNFKSSISKTFPDHSTGIKKTLNLSGFALLPVIILRVLFFDTDSELLFAGVFPIRYVNELFLATVIVFWLIRMPRKSEAAHVFINKTVSRFLELLSFIVIIVLFIESRHSVFPVSLTVYAILLVLLGGYSKSLKERYSRLILHSLFIGWIACVSLVFTYGPFYYPSLKFGEQPWLLAAVSILLLFAHIALMHRLLNADNLDIDTGYSVQKKISEIVLRHRNLFVFYPVIFALAFFFLWSFQRSLLTVLLCIEVFGVFVLSIILRENHFRYVSMLGLLACLIRLVMYDLVHLNTLAKALVCIVVAFLMLGMNILYNRFSDRYTDN